MKVSVVVCAYSMERYDDVCEAVESVLAQTHEDIEIILIIDGNEALFERLQSEFGNQEAVTLRCNEENKGLSYSRTQGVEQANGSVIAFLDDDAIAEPNWIEELVRGYEETDAIAVGGLMVPEWVAGRPDFLPEEFYWLIGANYEPRLEAWAEVRNTLGSNMSFRREVFEEVGGFDEQVGLKGDNQIQAEETELAMRMYDVLGKGMLYNPNAVVAHKVFDYRTEPRWLLRRAFWQGYSKRAIETLDVEGPNDPEQAFLRHLLFIAIPSRIRSFVRTAEIKEIQQIVAILLLTATVGAGYLTRLMQDILPFR
ncbi:glycosyl transferase family A [Halorubrum persicum]|uniref:Glycosyl transferase family A n=1 Tax=Halorubrum persicum TaxID=1383844 RepID=A0A2G1WK65_9EURY|nr:glucosyl-dolichyl phosphate glucuronosyltransferase [Halorubrum persicum]PHQ39382.1 glycosyl transferase family A [Halorubrum persicum]